MVGGQSVSERRIIPVGDLEREDAGASAVGAFEPVGVVGVVDQAGEREDLATGDGKAGEVYGGHGAVPFDRRVGGERRRIRDR